MPLHSTPIEKDNIFLMMAKMSRMMRDLDYSDTVIAATLAKIKGSDSYEQACAIINQYFPVIDK